MATRRSETIVQLNKISNNGSITFDSHYSELKIIPEYEISLDSQLNSNHSRSASFRMNTRS